ncbi:histidine kinase dimerization/phosphoacceptor domain -containing protein [Larkinella insperata]|uniref:histidine kinase n=1 Tax=Larkinella insperata TaxID=332158 RepID=A0ABW3QHW8_9BACT
MSAGVAYAQLSSITDADKLLKKLQLSRSDTDRVQGYLTLSEFYLAKNLDPKHNMDSALVFARQAEQLSYQLSYAKGVDESILLMGKVYTQKRNTETAQKLLQSLSDTNRIKLLLDLGKSKLRPTYTQLANRDSALLLFRQAETLSERIGNQKWKEESQCLMGVAHVLNKNWPQGKAYFMKVITARQQAGDKTGEIRALLRMVTTTFCHDCRENMHSLLRALSLARQIGDKPQEMLILMEMGYEHFQLDGGDIRQAERIALQVLAIQNTVGFAALSNACHALAQKSVYNLEGEYGYLSNANYFLSDLSQAKGDLNQKLFYILKVVKEVESRGMIQELDYAYFRLGNAYYELGLFDKSIDYHRKSLAISKQKGKLFIQMGLISRMVVTLLKQGKAGEALQLLKDLTQKNLPLTYEDKMLLAQSFGSCYSALKQYTRAEQYYLESVGWSKEIALQLQYAAWQRISQFYVANKQYTKADPYLNRLLQAVSEKKIIPSHQIEIHLMRFKVDSAQAKYTAAINHYQQYKALNDSIFNERKSKQIAQLSIQYETGKKEDELKLKEKDIALLTEQSNSQKNQRNALIGGTALLTALLGLGFNRYRLKQRSNSQLRLQQDQINQKNGHLQRVLSEKEQLIKDKEELLSEKDKILDEKDTLLQEREWMLKEIHHRVKNNLQVVMSLLNAQASYLTDDAALSAIQESQHRVQAMALIHQKLYHSEQMAQIEMPAYIQEVVTYLNDAYNLPQHIHFQLEVEPIRLDVTQAVPLGLIINEAITNALKYAFPQGRTGRLMVTLRQLPNRMYELWIRDNGVGLPAGYDPRHIRSLGMTLMHGFSQQLGGELRFNNNDGLMMNLVFPEV